MTKALNNVSRLRELRAANNEEPLPGSGTVQRRDMEREPLDRTGGGSQTDAAPTS